MSLRGFNSVVFIRLWALFSRFLLIGLAAIELTAGDFGQWSLIISAITLLSYLIGLDLYVPAVRALYEAKTRIEAVATVWSLALIYGLNFCIVCSAILGFEQLKIYTLGNVSILYFVPLLFFEHLSAEANRQLNLLGQHKQANYILLIRSSLPIAIFGLFCLVGRNHLSALLIAQVVGTSTAIGPACYYLKQYINHQFAPEEEKCELIEISLPNIISRKVLILLKGCGLAFLTTCILKASQNLDRQFLATMAELPRVGAYALTMTAANAISSAIDAVLVTTAISKLMDAVKNDDRASLAMIHLKLRRSLFILSSALHLIVMALFIIVQVWLSQSKYNFILIEVALLLFASFIANYSLADAAILFSLKKDKNSLWGAMLGMAALLIAIFVLKGFIGADAVAYGVLAASMCTWIVRKIATDSIQLTNELDFKK
jgi:O-antigen/teichoic acid export membrane protein